MHKALIFVLATSFVMGFVAPDDNVTAPVLKKARLGLNLAEPQANPKEREAPDKLTIAQIRSAVAAQTSRQIAGVSDLLRLDSRRMFVSGKGYMHVYGPTWIWPEFNSIHFHDTGSVHVWFTARPAQTDYLVDFQVGVMSGDVVVSCLTEDMRSETTLHEGKNHVLMLVNAKGGRQRVILHVSDGDCSIKGVEVSVLE